MMNENAIVPFGKYKDQPKPIETYYHGHRFRSRIEARWAVFYDALGIEFQYEPEGFALPSGWYLPDFFIPHIKSWIEIKREMPEDAEDLHMQLEELASATQQRVFLFTGDIAKHYRVALGESLPGNVESVKFVLDWDDLPVASWEYNHMWCECPECYQL
jgi:hypothetical protein